MTKTLLGNDYLAWIETGTPDTFAALNGQGTLSETRSSTTIDTSDKTSNGYDTEAYGNQKVGFSLDVRAKLPDAGYTQLEQLCATRTPFNFEVRKGGLAGLEADAIFKAQVNAMIASRTFTKDGSVDIKVTLSLNAAPTIDVLA